MGLCNEERIRGLYYDINAMVEHGRYLRRHLMDFQISDYKVLLEMIDKLWHGLLGINHNDSHWVLGSSATKEITWNTCTPWGIAINRHCNDIEKNKDDDIPRKKNEPEFDAFEESLNISGLLNSADPTCKEVYEIYAWSEQAIYHLRRYDDDLLKTYRLLDKYISQIQGECFRLFNGDHIYAAAYILHHICKLIYGLPSCYPYQPEKWDVVTTFIQETCMHHDFGQAMDRRSVRLNKMADMHKKLYQAKKAGKLTKMLRLETALQLAGRHFHHPIKFKELKNLLIKDKDFKLKDIKVLEDLFKANKMANDDEEKRSHEEYERYRESPMTIYGLSES